MALASLFVTLGLNSAQYEAGLKKAEQLAQTFGGRLKSFLSQHFGTQAIINYTQEVVNVAARIKDLSDQTRLSKEEVQRLDQAAKKNGLTFDDVAVALRSLTRARANAVAGLPGAIKAFNDFGVSMQDLIDPTRDNFDLLSQIGGSIEALGVKGARANEMFILVGKSGSRIASTLKDINREPITIIGDQQIERIDKAAKMLEELKLMRNAAIANVMADVLGVGDDTRPFLKRASERAQRDQIGMYKAIGRTLADIMVPSGPERVAHRATPFTAPIGNAQTPLGTGYQGFGWMNVLIDYARQQTTAARESKRILERMEKQRALTGGGSVF